MHYLRFQRFHPDFETPRERLFALSDAGGVKMTVGIDYGGETRRDSASRLVALDHSPKNESGNIRPPQNYSLCGDQMNSPAQIVQHMTEAGFQQVPISSDEFNIIYQKAAPKGAL